MTEGIIPETIMNLPVRYKWSDLNIKKTKNPKIKIVNNLKFAQFDNGFIFLCCKEGCNNLHHKMNMCNAHYKKYSGEPINIITVYPHFYNGLPIVKKCKNINVNIRKDKFEFITYQNCRIAVFLRGCVLLCSIDQCRNAQSKNSDICLVHIKGKQSFTFCRYITCTKQAFYGYEGGQTVVCKEHALINMIRLNKITQCDTESINSENSNSDSDKNI